MEIQCDKSLTVPREYNCKGVKPKLPNFMFNFTVPATLKTELFTEVKFCGPV